MASNPEFITGPLLGVKMSAFSFIVSKAINANKCYSNIYVPSPSVSGCTELGSLA